MPTYVVRCPNCGDGEIVARMSEAAPKMPCPGCQRPRPQVYHAPQFQQDNLRLWRGPQGNGWSNALGAQMPDNRRDRDRLARSKGVEFCSVEDLRRDNPEAAGAIDYHKHVTQGGERNDPKPQETSHVWKDKA